MSKIKVWGSAATKQFENKESSLETHDDVQCLLLKLLFCILVVRYRIHAVNLPETQAFENQ
jgi:hypothetical protein